MLKRTCQNWTYELKGLFFRRGIKMFCHNRNYNFKCLFFWRNIKGLTRIEPTTALVSRYAVVKKTESLPFTRHQPASVYSCKIGSSLCSYVQKCRPWHLLKVINILLIGIYNTKCPIYLSRGWLYVQSKLLYPQTKQLYARFK